MKQRLITGILAGAGFLVLLYWGGLGFAALILLMALIGYDEWIRMHGARRFRPESAVGYLGTACLVIPWERWFSAAPSFEASIWCFTLLFLALTVFTKNRLDLRQASVLLIGMVYIGLGFHYMIETRMLAHGWYWTMLAFVCIWATDSGAYFSGWAFGKRLLWPVISPKKTVEGAVGGIVFAVVAAIVFSVSAPDLLDMKTAVFLGVAISVLGQLGDLIESAYKRSCGVKDSGSLFPGHGGILDRCDSWIIVFPFFYWVMYWIIL